MSLSQGLCEFTLDKRFDLEVIVDLVEEGSKVLDIGCGDGDLLALLKVRKDIKGYGIEIQDHKIVNCINKGLTVFQGNIDDGLCDYGNKVFDYAILSQTLQVLSKPEMVIDEILRVARKGIISFPNFAHWQCRLSVLLSGSAPITRTLPNEWYDTANTRVITIKDFIRFCKKKDIRIEKETDLIVTHNSSGKLVSVLPNLRAHYGVFVISRD